MWIALGLRPWQQKTGVAAPQPPQPPLTGLSAIAADGWSGSYAGVPASFDPVGAPETVTVQRQGFDAAGAAVTVSDTLTITKRRRQPYPASGAPSGPEALTPDQVILSDYVYATDTISGVTNGSVWPAPLPVACWLTPDNLLAQGASFRVRLAVAHAHARNGRPVAAVRFKATDGTGTVTVHVATMSTAQFASGLWAPFFEADIPLAGLAQGALVTVDAEIYPWVGRMFTISADADAYPSANLTVLKFTNDRTGGFGTAYGFVAAGAVGGAVSADPAAAAAAPFPTVAAAAAAIRSFNNANFGRDNASGGVIRLTEGSHVHTGFGTVPVGNVPLRIEAVGQRAATFYQDSGASANAGFPGKMHFRGLTLRKTGGSVTFLDSANAAANMMIFEDVAFDVNGTSDYNFWLWRVGRMYFLNTTLAPSGFTSMLQNASNVYKAVVLALGCTNFYTPAIGYALVANRGAGVVRPVGDSAKPQSQGLFVGWNMLSNASGYQIEINDNAAAGPRGLAIVGNVLETTTAITAPGLRVHGDSNSGAIQNALLQGNSIVGSRSNWLYQDSGGTTVEKRGYRQFNIHQEFNIKSDLFGTPDGARTGNWSQVNGVGCRSEAYLMGDTNAQSAPGTGRWIGELFAAGTVSGTDAMPLAAAFVSDASYYGSKAGSGDYRPGAGSALPLIPAGLAPYPIDQLGRAISNSGTGKAGALQS